MDDLKRVHTYYCARRKVLEMMRDRNYKVPKILFETTEKEFEIMFNKKQMDLTGINDNNGLPVYVKIIEPSRQFTTLLHKEIFKEIAKYFNIIIPSIQDEKTLTAALDEGKIRLIIIYHTRHQEQSKAKHLEKYITDPYIEAYQVNNLSISPKDSKYQDKWRLILDPQEIADIYARYDAKPIMFGSVCIDDPMNRYYGGRPAENGKPAQIFEITRGGVSIFYRKVISKTMNIKKQ